MDCNATSSEMDWIFYFYWHHRYWVLLLWQCLAIEVAGGKQNRKRFRIARKEEMKPQQEDAQRGRHGEPGSSRGSTASAGLQRNGEVRRRSLSARQRCKSRPFSLCVCRGGASLIEETAGVGVAFLWWSEFLGSWKAMES